MIGPQLQGPVHPQPFGMPGLLQPPGPADPVQRLALMMALMVLGMLPVYSCHVPTRCGLPLGADMSEPRVCPPIKSETGIGISAMKEELDTKQWVRLPAVHCVAMQSSLSFMCGPDGGTKKVKYEKFRQPCGVQPMACWEALKYGRLKVGEAEYPKTMNQTRSHMAGEERYTGSCGTPAVALERSVDGSSGGGRLDLVERGEESSGHQIREDNLGPQEGGGHPGGRTEGMESRG